MILKDHHHISLYSLIYSSIWIASLRSEGLKRCYTGREKLFSLGYPVWGPQCASARVELVSAVIWKKWIHTYIFWAHIIWRYINSSWTSLKFQAQFELTFSKPFVDWVILGQSESVWDFPLPFQWGILDSSRWKRHAPTECWHRNASQYPLDFQEKSLISRGILQQLICYVAECWTFNSWFDSDLIRTRQPFQLEEKRSNHYLQVDP